MKCVIIPFLCLLLWFPSLAHALELSLPLDVGNSLPVVVGYVDLDPRDTVCTAARNALAVNGSEDTVLAVSEAAVKEGVFVRAAASGRVERIGRTVSGDAFIDVRHEQSWLTRYAGLSVDSLAVKTGASVEEGQALGLLARGTLSAHSGLSFSLRRGGRAYCPFSGVPAGGGCNSRGGPKWSMRAELSMQQAPEAVLESSFGYMGPDGVVFPAPGTSFCRGDSPVYCVTFIGAKKGDLLRLSINAGATVLTSKEKAFSSSRVMVTECLAVPHRSALSKAFGGSMQLLRNSGGKRTIVLKASAAGSWR